MARRRVGRAIGGYLADQRVEQVEPAMNVANGVKAHIRVHARRGNMFRAAFPALAE